MSTTAPDERIHKHEFQAGVCRICFVAENEQPEPKPEGMSAEAFKRQCARNNRILELLDLSRELRGEIGWIRFFVVLNLILSAWTWCWVMILLFR